MRLIFFDLETQYLAAEVGGWGNIEALRVAVGCTYDEDSGYRDWWEAQAGDLIEELRRAELIVGFNIGAFDFRVLALYGNVADLLEKAFDIHDEIWQQTRKRVSLERLARLNLGESKTLESGVQAVQLYRTGELQELAAYCRRDVELARRLFELWEEWGLLWVAELENVVWPGIKSLDALAVRKREWLGGAAEAGED